LVRSIFTTGRSEQEKIFMNKKEFSELREHLDELGTFMAAASKKEHSKLIAEFKDNIKTISKEVTTIKESQIRAEEHTRAVDDHLELLNSKVATNVKNVERNKLLISSESELRKDALNNALEKAVKPIADKVESNSNEIFSAKRIVAGFIIASGIISFLLFNTFQNLVGEEVDEKFDEKFAELITK